jgi:predicted P-loop ATPase
MKVSYYQSIKTPNSKEVADVVAILDNIKNGVYEDVAHAVRIAKNEEEKKAAKNKAPIITVSGTFNQRKNDALISHSGLIAMDFDDINDYGDAFNLLINDPYSYAVFMSISGKGICCLVKIDGKRHLDAFLGLEQYYYENYKLQVDRACKDVSRPRFLSYDPDLFLNEQSQVFKLYPKKETKQQQQKINNFSGGNHYSQKFELILSRINKDLTNDYADWLKIGFAIASEYGEGGLDYFKYVSSFSHKYNEFECEKKYKTLLGDASNGVNISSFYYICQQNGIDITDQREVDQRKEIQRLKQLGKTKQEVIQAIPNAINEIVDFEFNRQTPAKNNQLDINLVEQFIREKYPIKKNEVTRFYELDGVQLEQQDLNTIYIDVKKVFSKASREIIESIIFSNYTEKYNPLLDYFNGLKWDGKDHLAELTHVITSNTGDFAYRLHGLQYWLCGIIDSVINQEPNLLCLVLAGQQNTGKSTFFTKLLPNELKKYFSTSQLDRGKDDEILMCQSLIIFDDEFSGKSKQDAKQMKRLLSAHSFTLREPYGRQNVTLKRLATLCGTCNELDVLNDPTGNRRFIVYDINGQFDYERYNKIDKSQLFAQCVELVKNGKHRDKYDIFLQDLQDLSGEFMEVSIEEELLNEFFMPSVYGAFYQTTKIKDIIEEHTQQKLGVKKLGQALNKLKFNRIKQNGIYGYMATTRRAIG